MRWTSPMTGSWRTTPTNRQLRRPTTSIPVGSGSAIWSGRWGVPGATPPVAPPAPPPRVRCAPSPYPAAVVVGRGPPHVAGVEEIVLWVPPGPDGHIDDATLAAAAVAGIDEVFCVGGAQAIAAMAYGTESIDPVDVIVGPGNRYVADAKRQVSGVVGVTSAFAGPSEVVVIAGPDPPTEWAAIDLVVQAEHGPDGMAWLITWSEAVAEAVAAHVDRIVKESPRRAELEATLGAGGFAVLVDGPKQAIAIANRSEERPVGKEGRS